MTMATEPQFTDLSYVAAIYYDDQWQAVDKRLP